MRYSSYGQMDGIPTKTSELYNDAGFLNESEVEEKVTEGIDIENATDGQILSVTVDGTSYSPNWIDAPSGGSLDYSTNEQDTGTKWIDNNPVYVKSFTGIIPASDNALPLVTDGDIVVGSHIWYKTGSSSTTWREANPATLYIKKDSLSGISLYNTSPSSSNFWTYYIVLYYTKTS